MAVRVEQIDAQFGRGLVAERDIKEGEQIHVEWPVSCVQHSENKAFAIACQRCLKAIADPEAVLRYRLETPMQLPSGIAKQDSVECGFACGVVYCSELCRQAHWKQSHDLLCTGTVQSEEHPLVQFKRDALQVNDQFVSAAELVIDTLRSPTSTFNDLLDEYHHSHWWQAKLPDDEMTLEEHKTVIQEALLHSYGLLLRVLEPHFDADSLSAFTIDVFSYLMGIFEFNNISIEYDCAVQALLEEEGIIVPVEAALAHEEQCCGSDEDEDLWPGFAGVGLYKIASKMNHSCTPNIAIEYSNCSQLILLATRTIAAGEQILHSYVEKDDGYDERTEQLREYQFVCTCTKCSSRG